MQPISTWCCMGRLDFGLQFEPQYGFSYEGIRGIAAEAERLGFESIWVSDHLFMTDESVDTPCLECWTTLSALARDTRRLRLGSMVSSQSYRNPALMAKIAASLDNVSGGRLNFGAGAGWKEVEYRAYGYWYPPPVVRIRQLDEALEIARLMWSRGKATYRGRYYSVEEAICAPKPVQKPSIPIWVGGTGDLTLRVAARHADAVNFAWSQPPSFFEERLSKLEAACQRIGRDYNEIRKSAALMITMAGDQEGLELKLGEQRRRGDTPYMRYLGRQPPNMIGTPDVVADRIREYVGLGVDHFILRFHFGEELESMRLFRDEVRPRL
jgi:F420-dependent oxidoreductase-like protein